MSDPTLPPSLAAEIAELKRRLNNLERSQRLPFSSTRGGAFLFLDDDGNTRKTLGNVNLDGSIGGVTAAYGEFMRGDGGALIFMTREGERGMVYPEVTLPGRALTPTFDLTITSGTFTSYWEYRNVFPAYEVFNLIMQCATDVGTTGEVRLLCGATATSVATIPSNGNGEVHFEWLHPAPTGLYDPRARPEGNLVVGVQVRRASGAGNVYIDQPYEAKLTSKLFLGSAATNGNPSFV